MKKKKVLLGILLSLIAVFAFTIQASAAQKTVTKVERRNFTASGSYKHYAKFYGYTKSGQLVWTHKTSAYPLTELSSTEENQKPIVRNNLVYYSNNNRLIALNKNTGKIAWKTPKYSVGVISGHCFDKKGNIYICGYYGPDLVKVNKKGKVLWKREHVNARYYWAYQVKVKNNYLILTYGADSKNYHVSKKQIKVSMSTGRQI